MKEAIQKYIRSLQALISVPDLRRRTFVILLLLAAFRLMANVPIPGIDRASLQAFFNQSQLLGLFNVFSGNALSNFSIAMLGVAPYITATIILQLLTMVFPKLKEMYYEGGDKARQKFNQYGRLLTVPLAFFQSLGFISFLRSQPGISLQALGPFELIRDAIVVTAGSVLIMYLGELISEQKLGNGISLIIFAGIVADLPGRIGRALAAAPLQTGNITQFLLTDGVGYLLFLMVAIGVILGVVMVTEADRKIPVVYAKRVRGTKIYGGASTYLPIKVNNAGVIPIIFALSILVIPNTIAQVLKGSGNLMLVSIADAFLAFLGNNVLYAAFYFILVILFTYFYTAITFEPNELSNNLQKNGALLPGVRPGKETAKFLGGIVHKTTLGGALFLGVIAILPFLMQAVTGISTLAIGGTSVLILVSVALETLNKIDAELSLREYEI